MKRNICILLVACLVKISYGFAQRPTIDSLKQLLNSAEQDSTRSLLLGQLSHEYNHTNVDTALMLGEEGLTLAKKINFVKGEAECLRQIGFSFSEMGYEGKGLQLMLDALKMAESIHDQNIIIRTLLGIGVTYGRQQDYARALQYRLLAKDLASTIHNERLLMTVYLDLGADYEHLKRFDSAVYYSDQAFALGTKLGNKYTIGSALESLGDIYSKINKDSMAMNNYRVSIPFCIESGDNDDFCGSTIGMAYIFRKHGQQDSSLDYARLSYSTARKAGFVDEQLGACRFLADYYKEHRMHDSAFIYLSKAVVFKDSLFSLEKTREMQRLTTEEAMRQQDMATQKTKAEEDRVRGLQLLAIGVFIPIFFVGVLLLSKTKVRPRVVEFLGIVSLLLLFEFITDLIFPYISLLANENPIWEMLVLVILASLLEPLNFKLEHWVKDHLVRKPLEQGSSVPEG
jgi:tetratricopeptide (TPR) repeat protein